MTLEISVADFRTMPDRPTVCSPETRRAVRVLGRPSARSGELSPLSYNLTVSHHHRFLWFRVAKVGTRTLLGYFRDHGIPLDVEHAARLRYPTALFSDYYKFAFVRHPLDRFVSAWRDKVIHYNHFGFDEETHARMQRIEAFAEWAAGQDLADLERVDRHLALQVRLVDLTQVDYLGRLETFDADFAAVCDHLRLPVVVPEARNQSVPRGGPDPEHSEDLVAIVREAYRLDFQVFGY